MRKMRRPKPSPAFAARLTCCKYRDFLLKGNRFKPKNGRKEPPTIIEILQLKSGAAPIEKCPAAFCNAKRAVSGCKTFRFACGKQTQRNGVIIQKNVNHGRGGELSAKQSLQGLWRVLDLPLPAAPRVQLECKPSAAIHMGVARPIKVLDDGAAVVNVKTWRQS